MDALRITAQQLADNTYLIWYHSKAKYSAFQFIAFWPPGALEHFHFECLIFSKEVKLKCIGNMVQLHFSFSLLPWPCPAFMLLKWFINRDASMGAIICCLKKWFIKMISPAPMLLTCFSSSDVPMHAIILHEEMIHWNNGTINIDTSEIVKFFGNPSLQSSLFLYFYWHIWNCQMIHQKFWGINASWLHEEVLLL